MRALSFAHLLGSTVKPAAARAENENPAEDDDIVQREDESDEDFAKRKSEAEEDKKRDDESDDEHQARVKSNKAKRAKAEADDGDDEEGDDQSDGADMRTKSARAARLRERARCSAIFADAAAGKNQALAAQLAFGTDLTRSQAVKVLRTGGLAVSGRPSLDQRMASVQVPAIGAGEPAPPTGATSLAAKILAAGRKARGKA